MAVIDEFLRRFDRIVNDFTFNRERRMQQIFGQSQREVIHFKNEPKRKPVALFGSDPNEAFSLDWVSYRSPKLNGPGTQPLEHHENVHGYVNPDSKRPIVDQEPYMDAATSRIFKRTSEATDQKPTSIGHDVSTLDKEVTLWKEPKKSLEGSRTHEKTIGDRIAEEMKKESYWFIAE
jgi:hypothetical protein